MASSQVAFFQTETNPSEAFAASRQHITALVAIAKITGGRVTVRMDDICSARENLCAAGVASATAKDFILACLLYCDDFTEAQRHFDTLK